MKLSDDQVNSFKELGYVFIENVFNSEEVKKMNDELPKLYNLDREEVQKEQIARLDTIKEKRNSKSGPHHFGHWLHVGIGTA